VRILVVNATTDGFCVGPGGKLVKVGAEKDDAD
jgi:hypothetical protein